MYIYLNAPRVFWQIPGTEIRLTRSKPIVEVTDAEIKELSPEQKEILIKGVETNVLTKVNKSFVPTAHSTLAIKILKLPVQEIQRRYVSQMILTKNLEGIEELLSIERKATKTRQSVIEVLESAKGMVLELSPNDKYYQQIEEAVEDIEGVIVKESPPSSRKKKALPTRKTRRQTKTKTTGEIEK